ncbi:MAG: DUF86 domain-containing protein [Cyanobacteria bacterium P01_E01_bin.42]
MRSDRERLLDIQEAIAKIEQYANQGREAFEKDELIQVWILHHLQIIGEAASAMSEALSQKYNRVPWQDMADFRNVLVHEYFRIDLDIIWEIVKKQIPNLKKQIVEILSEVRE